MPSISHQRCSSPEETSENWQTPAAHQRTQIVQRAQRIFLLSIPPAGGIVPLNAACLSFPVALALLVNYKYKKNFFQSCIPKPRRMLKKPGPDMLKRPVLLLLQQCNNRNISWFGSLSIVNRVVKILLMKRLYLMPFDYIDAALPCFPYMQFPQKSCRFAVPVRPVWRIAPRCLSRATNLYDENINGMPG
mgnify:CR=1 FL=1|jgi:hypothetical protein